jgi:hypothetical protein
LSGVGTGHFMSEVPLWCPRCPFHLRVAGDVPPLEWLSVGWVRLGA